MLKIRFQEFYKEKKKKKKTFGIKKIGETSPISKGLFDKSRKVTVLRVEKDNGIF